MIAAAMLLVLALGIYFESRSRYAGQPLRPQAPACRSVLIPPRRPAPFSVIGGGRQ